MKKVHQFLKSRLISFPCVSTSNINQYCPNKSCVVLLLCREISRFWVFLSALRGMVPRTLPSRIHLCRQPLVQSPHSAPFRFYSSLPFSRLCFSVLNHYTQITPHQKKISQINKRIQNQEPLVGKRKLV